MADTHRYENIVHVEFGDERHVAFTVIGGTRIETAECSTKETAIDDLERELLTRRESLENQVTLQSLRAQEMSRAIKNLRSIKFVLNDNRILEKSIKEKEEQ